MDVDGILIPPTLLTLPTDRVTRLTRAASCFGEIYFGKICIRW
jgi:hypothetical protein